MNIRILLTLLLITNIWFSGFAAAIPNEPQNNNMAEVHTEQADHDCCKGETSIDNNQCLSHCYGLASTTLSSPNSYLFDTGAVSMLPEVIAQLSVPPIYPLFRPPTF